MLNKDVWQKLSPQDKFIWNKISDEGRIITMNNSDKRIAERREEDSIEISVANTQENDDNKKDVDLKIKINITQLQKRIYFSI